MKKSTNHILFILFVFLSLGLVAQSPNAIKYQGVVRDAAGDVIKNQAVSFQFKIHDGSSSGPIVYTETHTVNTNDYGLVNLEIGNGSTSDAFSAISWEGGDKYLEVLLDLSGGSSYMTMGAFQLISVPYALFANKSETVADNAISNSKLQNQAVTLNKISNAGASSGDVLSYDGSALNWSPAATSSGDITAVTAGDGLTGGAVSGNAILNIGAGTGIIIGTDNISLDESHTDALYVDEGQANSISTAMVQNQAITHQKVSGTGATSGQVLSYNGTNVEWATPASPSGNTLDEAYDEGGLGAGRVINATNGAVYISGTGGLISDGGISVGMNSSTNDDMITFDYGSTPERIIWDNSESKFYITDDLRVTGTIGNSTTTVPYNTLFDNGSAVAPTSGQMGNEGDLYIEYDLEVGNNLYVRGELQGNVPGVAADMTTSITSVAASGVTNIMSISFSAPGPGYVLVQTSGFGAISGTVHGNIIASIETSATTTPGSVSRVVFGSSGETVSGTSVYRWGSLNTQRIFSIPRAGTYRYYFNASRGYTVGSASVVYPSMSLMYFNQSHGTISVSATPESTINNIPVGVSGEK